jgi:hypothetical protein
LNGLEVMDVLCEGMRLRDCRDRASRRSRVDMPVGM